MLVLNATEINNGLLPNATSSIDVDISASSVLRFVGEQLVKPIMVSLINSANINLTTDVIPNVLNFLESFLGDMDKDQIEYLSEQCEDKYTVYQTVGDVLSDEYYRSLSIVSLRNR